MSVVLQLCVDRRVSRLFIFIYPMGCRGVLHVFLLFFYVQMLQSMHVIFYIYLLHSMYIVLRISLSNINLIHWYMHILHLSIAFT